MLFSPVGKVQKDRVIMRETDARMAKYSRRGLVVNFLAYLLCLSLGDMHLVAPTASVVLTAGLIVTMLIRAYFLLRFDAIYSAGPARWRRYFFISTMAGAAWWSIILTTSTLILGMVSETPILWLYTVIFFATTTQVTAPFRRFSQIYQAIALFPPAVAAIYTGGFDGYMYGLMMCIYMATLYHQADLLYSTYWKRLESNYELKIKAKALETEKRKVDASVNLNTHFLNSLWQQMSEADHKLSGLLSLLGEKRLDDDLSASYTGAREALAAHQKLLRNIRSFALISNGDVELNTKVFHLRSTLETWVDDFKVAAEARDVELSFRIYPECPDMAQGDPKLIARIFESLMGSAISTAISGTIFVVFDFRGGKDEQGHLEITIVDRTEKEDIARTSNLEEMLRHSHLSGLWYPISKCLAENLGGSVEIDKDGKEAHYLFHIPLTMVEKGMETAVDSEPT